MQQTPLDTDKFVDSTVAPRYKVGRSRKNVASVIEGYNAALGSGAGFIAIEALK